MLLRSTFKASASCVIFTNPSSWPRSASISTNSIPIGAKFNLHADIIFTVSKLRNSSLYILIFSGSIAFSSKLFLFKLLKLKSLKLWFISLGLIQPIKYKLPQINITSLPSFTACFTASSGVLKFLSLLKLLNLNFLAASAISLAGKHLAISGTAAA